MGVLNILIRGFGIDDFETAMKVACPYSDKYCDPPWSEWELKKKVLDVMQGGHPKSLPWGEKLKEKEDERPAKSKEWEFVTERGDVFAAHDFKPPVRLVGPILEESITYIFAAANALKTWFALEIVRLGL